MTDAHVDTERIRPLSLSESNKLLEQRAKERGHERQQKLLDALTTVAYMAIYVVPSILALLYMGVLIHKAWIGQWDGLEDTLKSMLVPITTYLAGLLSKNVLPKSN